MTACMLGRLTLSLRPIGIIVIFSIHYKCPGFYCVPWQYVCDGIWHCPGGREEMNCSKRSCENQFRCRNSSICLHTLSICDAHLDCPLHDDEVFCDTKFPTCPLQCICLLYVIACKGLDLQSVKVSFSVSVVSQRLTGLFTLRR